MTKRNIQKQGRKITQIADAEVIWKQQEIIDKRMKQIKIAKIPSKSLKEKVLRKIQDCFKGIFG